MLTARWSDRLDVVDFKSALFASLIISIVTTIINQAFKSIRRFDNKWVLIIRWLVIFVVVPYDPVATRWLCPNCHMKTNCCDGAPCEIVEVKTTTSELKIT